MRYFTHCLLRGTCNHQRLITEWPWLSNVPLASSQSVDHNKEFDVSDIFSGVSLILHGGELVTIEDPSLSNHGYQLLPLATSQSVGDNKEFYILDIFSPVLLIVSRKELMTT